MKWHWRAKVSSEHAQLLLDHHPDWQDLGDGWIGTVVDGADTPLLRGRCVATGGQWRVSSSEWEGPALLIDGTLYRMLVSPDDDRSAADEYLIWSPRAGWWRDGGMGYTTNLGDVGVYTLTDARMQTSEDETMDPDPEDYVIVRAALVLR